MKSPPCVLVVEPDRFERDRLGMWLNDAGYEVWLCPGPQDAAHACIALTGHSCALANGADVVVLDRDLSDAPALRASYEGLGLPVLGLDRPAERRALLQDLFLVIEGKER